jgi:phosphoribosyl 1,2-cyclic phosphodiesterase
MEITFWGVRGSSPVCGKNMVEYGGRTPCASLLTSEKHLIILDAGTGIIPLGETLMGEKKKKKMPIHLILTHFHIDHTLGLHFFAPLYSKKFEISFYSPLKPKETRKMLGTLMGGRFFPVDFNETESKKHFKQVPSEDFNIGNVRISHRPLHHPQGSLAYRFDEKEKSAVFATDTEHPEKGVDRPLVSFARKADVFVYDSTFTPKEYNQGKRGWGHSTWLEGTHIARQAEVKKLVLSHFNPSHSDEKIGMIIKKARKKFQETYGAKQGLTLRL